MPKNSDAKTESAPKFLAVVAVIVLAINLLIALLVFVPQKPRITINNTTVLTEVVDTPETMERGLSGRQNLPEDSGMLFMYAQSGVYCYWMKDMNFSIDMIWLDDQKKIVHIEPNVSPQTFPKSFCPSTPARYVLEVSAGKAEKSGWTVGSPALF